MRTLRRDGRWIPAGATHGYSRRFPEVGDMVAYDFRAWEVTHFRLDDFTDEDLERVRMYRAEARDRLRPYSVTLRRIYGPKYETENSRQEIGLAILAFASYAFDTYDNEGRVPLCSCCEHPWPCIISVAKDESEREAEKFEKQLARTGVGICYACGEAITQRQQSAQYGEGNVDLPGYPTPRFHLRQKCRSGRVGYMGRVAEAQGDQAIAPTVDGEIF